MKKLIGFIAIFIVFAIIGMAGWSFAADDITLTNPVEVKKKAVSAKPIRAIIEQGRILIRLNWIAADGSVVAQEQIILQNSTLEDGTPVTTYSDVVTDKITAADVGKSKLKVFMRSVREKIKEVRQIDGTVN